jgi:HlyD family secretion protein
MKLLPGMTANITVKIEEADSVLRVPASSLRFNPPQEFIAEMMKVWPDSVREKVSGWMQGGKKGTGRTPRQGGYSHQGAGPGKEPNRGKWNSGFVWIRTDKVLTPHRVRIGLTDGSYTEISGRINEGDEIVTGMMNTGQVTTTQQQQSPFMPQVGRRR